MKFLHHCYEELQSSISARGVASPPEATLLYPPPPRKMNINNNLGLLKARRIDRGVLRFGRRSGG